VALSTSLCAATTTPPTPPPKILTTIDNLGYTIRQTLTTSLTFIARTIDGVGRGVRIEGGKVITTTNILTRKVLTLSSKFVNSIGSVVVAIPAAVVPKIDLRGWGVAIGRIGRGKKGTVEVRTDDNNFFYFVRKSLKGYSVVREGGGEEKSNNSVFIVCYKEEVDTIEAVLDINNGDINNVLAVVNTTTTKDLLNQLCASEKRKTTTLCMEEIHEELFEGVRNNIK